MALAQAGYAGTPGAQPPGLCGCHSGRSAQSGRHPYRSGGPRARLVPGGPAQATAHPQATPTTQDDAASGVVGEFTYPYLAESGPARRHARAVRGGATIMALADLFSLEGKA